MSVALILATRYDKATQFTSGWAQELQHDLIQQGHTSVLLDGSAICRAGSLLQDAIAAADLVIFYGHGTVDEWTGLPAPASGLTTPIIHAGAAGNVRLLAGRPVYAGCCQSLTQLGGDYATQFPSGAYVGYDNRFIFEVTNERHFKDVVNLSVIGFVNGRPATQVVADLRNAWGQLRDDFLAGRLQYAPEAFAAAQMADLNAQRAGHQP